MPPQQRAQYQEYVAEQLEQMEAEQGLSDQAEATVAAVIYELLLAYGITQLTQLQLSTLISALEPVVKPFAMVTAQRMLPRRKRYFSVDLRDWDQLAQTITRAAVSSAYRAIRVAAKKAAAKPEDPYAEVRDPGQENPVEVLARRLARTIVSGVAEGMKAAVAERLGFDRRRWLTRLDTRVRHSHALLEGDTKPLGEPFRTVTGAELMYPGDPSAPPSEFINCRCSVVYLAPDEDVLATEMPMAADGVRHVRDTAYWGEAYGTPIVADELIKAHLPEGVDRIEHETYSYGFGGATQYRVKAVDAKGEKMGHLDYNVFPPEDGSKPTIQDLRVRSAYRKRGIAKELLRRAREEHPDLQHDPWLSDDGLAFAETDPQFSLDDLASRLSTAKLRESLGGHATTSKRARARYEEELRKRGEDVPRKPKPSEVSTV